MIKDCVTLYFNDIPNFSKRVSCELMRFGKSISSIKITITLPKLPVNVFYDK
jgi:hypothetical protein